MDSNLKKALIIIGGVVLVVLIISSLAPGMFGWGGYGMMGPGMMGGFGFGWIMLVLMAVFWVAFWGLVIWGVVALIRAVSRGGPGPSAPADSALEILKRRYARGEINKQEYEEKKKDLV